MRNLIFGETRVPLPASITTVEAARGFASTFVPGLADAEGHVDSEGNIVFSKKAGTKGL